MPQPAPEPEPINVVQLTAAEIDSQLAASRAIDKQRKAKEDHKRHAIGH